MSITLTATPGQRLRMALQQETPLQLPGATTAYHAILAARAGFRALYLSGGGVSASSLGLPDLGISTLEDVLVDVRRITAATGLPLLVDADTGFGPSAFNVARCQRELQRAGAAGMHLEDQVGAKRCGHRPGKEIVPTAEMVDRIKAALDARTDSSFVIMARTDALAREGLPAALERVQAYVEAGADMVFPEAVRALDEYASFTRSVSVPVLANLTEFGQTPLFTLDELRGVGVAVALYPLSAFRAASLAAEALYTTLRSEGTQRASVAAMQTREELYVRLGYHDYERKLDELFAARRNEGR